MEMLTLWVQFVAPFWQYGPMNPPHGTCCSLAEVNLRACRRNAGGRLSELQVGLLPVEFLKNDGEEIEYHGTVTFSNLANSGFD
jgi:hypothetical protein